VQPGSDAPEPATYRITDRGTGRQTGTVHIRTGAGLWGTITAAVGLDDSGRAVSGISFLKQNETPGLGARIDEPWFKAQFKGKTGPFRMVPEGTRSTAPDEFDAITGATVTSTAVRDMLNGMLE
jgi:Na+-transporting NADH:ubiquinone oxidoreductase subunit C